MSFKSHSKEDWLSQVRKELAANINLDDIGIKEKYFSHNGFPFSENAEDFGGRIPSSSFQGLADISGLTNDSMQKVLDIGIDTLYIKLSDSYFPDLGFIDFNYVNPIIEITDLKNELKDKFYKELNNRYSQNQLDKFIIINSKETKAHEYLKLNFSEETIAVSLKSLIDSTKNGINNFLLEFNTGINLNLNIGTLRAIRILLENIKIATQNPDINYKISVSPIEEIINPLTDQTIIKLNFFAISSILGTSDFIQFIPFVTNLEKARIAFNMINIFKHESFLDLYNDAVSGSWFYEDVTHQIAENLWKEIIE